MWILLHAHYGELMVALGLPPVWTKIPVVDHPGVAAVVLAVALVVFIVFTRARQGGLRRSRQPRDTAAEPVDASWFTAHTLDGFPEDSVRARLKAPDAPSADRLYAAWVLAIHGMDAAWLERNLSLPADVAHLIVEAAEPRLGNRESRDGPGGVPEGRKAGGGTATGDSVTGHGRDERR